MPITRSVFVCVAASLALGALAHADTGMLPNGAQIVWDKVFITENGASVEPTTPDALRQYLNLAHCACSQAGAGDQTTLSYQLSLTVDTNTNRPADVFVGTQCDDELLRPMKCRGINTIPDIDTLVMRTENLDISLYEAINAPDNTGACQQREGDAFVWIAVDANADNTYDYFTTQSLGNTSTTAANMKVTIDTQPPPLPTAFEGNSADGAISLSWSVPTSRATDVFYYQALCVGPDGAPVRSNPPAPRFQTVRTLCGLEQDIALPASDIVTDDTGTATLTPELMQLDPAFICAESVEPTATGLLIDGLTNDVPYTVVLVSIDFNGNPNGTYFTKTITPRPATDFWEDLHDRGSNVEGGFCLMAETYGDDSGLTQSLRAFRDDTLASTAFGRALIDAYYASLGKLGVYVHGSIALRIAAGIVLAPLVVVALAWHTLTLPGLLGLFAFGWLVRRRRRLAVRLARFAVPAALGVLVLAPSPARAQGITPYWEQDAAATAADEDKITWHAGVRVGPYTPAIDKQFGMEPGPYKEMFGKYAIMPMIDVDRIVWRGFGQLGVGGTIGYMQKSAKAWVDGSTPGDPMRPRSPGDENTFRLIPLAATVVYRLTYFDDDWGVPIVPYVRGGLSYYVWWMRSNGKTSTACWDGTHDANCDKDKAYGATLGLQGAIGLSIRAERIDAAASTSMRQGGIQHAGFYGELSLAKVDGFGSDTKLSVGDATWFAGVDFEF
jgi:hypothetical protein